MSTEDFWFSLGLAKAGLTEGVKRVAGLIWPSYYRKKIEGKKDKSFFPLVF
jgi:hypothetical protein